MTAAAALKEHATGKAPEQPQQTREITPYERFRSYVQTTSFLNDIAILVGGEAQARTFVRVVLTSVQQTPRLLEADRRTLLLACMKAARDRLMPDGKEAVLNIYNTKSKDPRTGRDVWTEAVQYLPMTAGLIKKMYDSGFVKFVDAAAVYKGDEFTYERGDDPKLVHKPTMGDDPGPIIAAYVVIKLTNGETKREVMPRRDIETVRKASKAPDGLMWKTYYDQGAIKSVIKRAYKQLPSSVELDQVIAHDNEAMGYRETPIGTDMDAFTEQPMQTGGEASTAGTGDAGAGDAAANADAGKPAALEHNPGQTVPMTIEGQATREVVEAGGEAPPVGASTAETATTTTDPEKSVPFADVARLISKAGNADALDIAEDQIRYVPEQSQRDELTARAKAKRKAWTQ